MQTITEDARADYTKLLIYTLDDSELGDIARAAVREARAYIEAQKRLEIDLRKREAEAQERYRAERDRKRDRCTVCLGSGKNLTRAECPHCGGSGDLVDEHMRLVKKHHNPQSNKETEWKNV